HQPEWSNKEFLSSFSKKVKIISYGDNLLPIYLTWKISGLIHRFDKNTSFRNWVNDRKYRRTLQKYKFDIINSQMYLSDRITSKIAVPLMIPFVITTHGEYELNFSHGNPDFDKEARNCLLQSSAVVYTAEKNIEAIRLLIPRNKPVRQIIVGFNGDSIRRF